MKLTIDEDILEPLIRRVVSEAVTTLMANISETANATCGNEAVTSVNGEILVDSVRAAQLLGISTRTLHAIKQRGEIPYVAVGDGQKKEAIRYAVDDLREWVQSRRVRANTFRNSESTDENITC